MKTSKRIMRIALIGILGLFLVTCQKESDQLIEEQIVSIPLKSIMIDNECDYTVYYPKEQFVRGKGKPVIVNKQIGNSSISDYEDCFVMYVKNGDGTGNFASSAIITVDGVEVLGTVDFRNKKDLFSIELCNLTEQSVLEVEIRGTRGSILEIWIEGILKLSDEGLVAYYPFDGNANDESGNENDGTVDGATLITDRNGNPNSAYYFDGVNDFINVPPSPILSVSHEFTISVWISPNYDNMELRSNYHIIKMGGSKRDTRNTNYRIGLFDDAGISAQLVHLGMGNGNTYYGYYMCNINEPIPEDIWTHVTATYNGENKTVKIFINGVINRTHLNVPKDPITGNWALRIGDDYGGWKSFYEGLIDDIRIYNRVLSEAEVSALYRK